MNFPFDVEEAMRTGVYGSGSTGMGKSDVFMEIAEKLMKENIIVVVFDPSQDWQERSTIPQFTRPVISEYLWNEQIQWENLTSCIWDLSQLTTVEMQGFVEDFCKKLMKWQSSIPQEKRKRIFLIFEEGQIYFPEGCMNAKAYRNTSRMMTVGRNFGIRFACITQFASAIDKKAMRYMRQRYFGYTDEPNDTEYVLKMFPKQLREQINLRGLQAGQFYYKCGDAYDQFQIEPFKNNTQPQKIEPPEPTEPITPISFSLKSDDKKALAKLTIAILFFVAIIVALIYG